MTASGPARLGIVDGSLIVVGSVVGAGIFLVSPSVAQHVHSPAAFLGTWLLGGAVAVAGALANGELGGLFPRSGGEYVYLREAYGPLFGFLSGWMSLWIAFPGSIAALAAGFGLTVAPMFGFHGPGARVGIGAAAIVALTAVNAFGLRPGKWTQNVLSGAKLAAIAALLGLGFFVARGSAGGLVPFLVPGDTARGTAEALVPVFFAYSGWNAATYITGEMRDPQRSLGRALALGTSLCLALYLLINAVYLRAMPVDALARTTDPARAAATVLGGPVVAAFLSPLIAVCVLSSMQASVLVGPRIYQAMAVDGLFFAPAARVHPKTQTPLLSLLVQSAIALVQLFSGSFDQLLNFSTVAILAFATLAVVGVLVLRVRRPDVPRPFRVPIFAPLLFIGVNVWVLWSVLASGAREARIGLAIVASGVPVYVAFRLLRRSPEPAP
ncbi:MAG TPA: amino acid permease [Polyangiaceae bacterium]|jgi:APA family basic amino acid/polyamine antiporter